MCLCLSQTDTQGKGGKKREQEGWVKSDRREEGGKNEPERQAKGHEKEKQKRKVFCGCFGWMNASMHRHACLYRANTYVMVESVPGAKQIGGGDKQTERIISFPDLNLFHSCLSCSSYRCSLNRRQTGRETDTDAGWPDTWQFKKITEKVQKTDVNWIVGKSIHAQIHSL